jgi:hypothetical protein
VFRGIEGCVGGALEEPVAGHRYVLGWDVAKHSDFSVLCVLDAASAHLVAFERFNQIAYTEQLRRVEALARRYGAFILMDATGVGDPIFEQVQQLGLGVEGFTMTATPKQQLIEHLVVGIEQRALSFPEIVVLTGSWPPTATRSAARDMCATRHPKGCTTTA